MLGANWASAFFGPEAHTDGYRSILVYVCTGERALRGRER
jgi:hypothetical protein